MLCCKLSPWKSYDSAAATQALQGSRSLPLNDGAGHRFENTSVITVLLNSQRRRGLITDSFASPLPPPPGLWLRLAHYTLMASRLAGLTESARILQRFRTSRPWQIISEAARRLFTVNNIRTVALWGCVTRVALPRVPSPHGPETLTRPRGHVGRICLPRIDQRDTSRSMAIRRGPLQIYVRRERN